MRILTIIMLCLFLLWKPLKAEPALSPLRETEIRNAVSAFVQQKTANLGCETSIRRLSISGNPLLPEGTLEYEVVAPQQWEGWGSVSIAVIARQKDRIVRNIAVRVEVEALADMVVTVRQIDRGQVLSAADLAVRRQDVAASQGRYLKRIEDAVGKVARTTLKPNSTLRNDQLEKVPLVKSGQMVTIVAESPTMRITVTGKARGSGAEGDTIVVQNLNSLKELSARIIDAGTVLVVF
ncbi:flagellar basal body P-ring formation chaperone FlgA [Geobacter sp. SVR]|uniref:flagellar basal body P-ring formation chaperone FlgA n=1 Tax=Geobacter sp. SVR TaxID=2495594 RepID=UPI00143F0287|nr:flagellar basal body P-ring formation chaperone FlgA [Geobacter sp. SVR]BCS55804.1 flagella basal body P-ring formation protein FlgA [Geobacter sp. SVR]GCF83808.1 flagella basal body P-ring formation protein FlgA [Geobacter sp. SVR]